MSSKNFNFIYLGIAIAVGIFIGSFFNFGKSPSVKLLSNNKQEAKIKRLIDNIHYEYVDDVDTDSLLDKTITQILSNLDPHSVYIPKDEVSRVRETMDGKFIGIGVQFRMIKDTVTVIKVLEGGPSEKAGIQSGDRLLIANQDTLYGKQYFNEDVIGYLKSDKPNPIDLQVYRKKTKELLNFHFKRGDVDLKSVPVYYMLNKTLGYIKVELFSRTTFDEFHQALEVLKQKGMQSLVLDLRNNTGGFLDIANDIIDEFLTKGQLMVFTKSKSGRISESFATNQGAFESGNLYVLINEESASASEILAGAIQDNDRGTIVGRRSFGKGLVQQEMNLGDGSMVRLTTARYYTPTGRSIQKPYDHNGNIDYFHDSETRMTNGELLYKDSIPIVDSLKYKTPKGKIVYGGGGIVPDVFVPLDTTLYFKLYHMKHINDFVFDYIDEHRTTLDSLDFDTFNSSFDIEKPMQEYLKNYPVEVSDKNQLHWYLKSLFARELFGDNGFYKIYQEEDKMIQKVIALEQNQ